MSAKESAEFWRPFPHPRQFEGVLPPLWREQGVTIYGVPQRSVALAHVVPAGALVRRQPVWGEDVSEVRRYVAALEDRSLPEAEFAWRGRNTAVVRAVVAPGQAVSVQVNYDQGWRARVNGTPAPVRRDGLGLMYVQPERAGPCDIELEYTGGWEAWVCRALSVIGILGAAVYLWLGRVRGARPGGD